MKLLLGTLLIILITIDSEIIIYNNENVGSTSRVYPSVKQGLFAMFSSKCNICCIVNSTNTPFITLDSQRIMISYNINHMFMGEEI